MRRLATASLLSSAFLSPALAHDLWLQPEREGEKTQWISIRPVVGAAFPKWEEAKKVEEYGRARILRGAGAGPLGRPNEDPTLLGRVEGDEAFFVSVIGPRREIDLKPMEAREYLRGEAGLDVETIDRILHGSGPTVHETYLRFLKTLVIPGPAKSIPADRSSGLPLEILLLRWERGHDLRVSLAFRLLEEGKPLAGAAVRVVSPGSRTLFVRTDSNGEAMAMANPAAPTLIAYIHVAGWKTGRYETLWTNLAVFDLRETPAP